MSDKNPIGNMSERVEFFSPATTTDATGGQVTTWTSLVSVWAKAEPMIKKLGEDEIAEQVVATRGIQFTIWQRNDITEVLRLTWRDESYDIASVNRIGRQYSQIEAYRRDNLTS